MTETILSPGIYTQENDQSFIPPGQTQTGLAVVGPSQKGAAFVPTDVTSYADFVAKFGADTSTSYVPQTVYTYLQAGSSAKVTRVLGNGGFLFNTTRKIAAIVSGSKILSVLLPSQNNYASVANLNGCSISGSFNNFTFVISGSQLTTKTLPATSLVPTDSKYLLKQIGTDQFYATSSVFPYLTFSNYFTGSVSASASASGSLKFNVSSVTFTSSYAEGYAAASTPWILSDAGNRLFQFVHTSHGTATNRDVKISIDNITPNADPTIYTTFDVLVRTWNDTDKIPSIIEQ